MSELRPDAPVPRAGVAERVGLVGLIGPGGLRARVAPWASARAARRLAVFTLAYYVVLGYPPLRVLDWLVPAWSPSTATLAAVFTLPAAGWLAHQRWRNRLTRAGLRATYTWLGTCFLALPVLAALELAVAALRLPPPAAGAWALGVVGALAGAAVVNAQLLAVRRIELGAAGLERAVRIVQLSDVHVGSRGRGFLERVVARANALAPDLVVITGDLVDLREVPEAALAPLARLRAPAYFAIGNHERYIGAGPICERIARTGVRVLRDAAGVAGPLQLVGIDDAERRDQVARRLARIPLDPARVAVLLYHRPDGLEAAARAGIRLMLSGHTHDGQLFPFNYLVRRVFPRIRGLHAHGGTVLYVSPGTGTWGPVMRLGSRNEITEIVLRPEGAECARRT